MADDVEEDRIASTTDEVLSNLWVLSIQCKELLHQLSAGESSADAVEARDVMASFNIWATNIGVFRAGQQSLASRLKNAPQISGLVQRLLLALRHDLEKKLHGGKFEDQARSDNESDASSDRSSTSSYRLVSPSDDSKELYSSTSRSKIWTSIQETITSLRQLAITIHLAGSQHRQERIQRFKNLDCNRSVYEVFKKYARQRIDYMFPHASETLRTRMADSIATRRVRFMYLERHQKKTSTLNDPAPVLSQSDVPKEETFSTTGTGQQETTKGVLPHERNQEPNLQPSLILSNTLVTKLDPKRLSPTVKKSKLAESVTSVKISTGAFPKTPKLEPEGNSFNCPYCFLICPAKEVSGQKEWMSHLINDFEPFFCVFDECASPFICADTHTGWLAHMRDKHTKPEWECWHCKMSLGLISFKSPQELESHLKTSHENDTDASLRPTLVKHSMTSDKYILRECPFCGGFPEEIEKGSPGRNSKQALESLEKHVRDHLIDVALILAPKGGEELDGELDDTKSDAPMDNNSERDDGGVGEIYDMQCQKEKCDCKNPALRQDDINHHRDIEDVQADSNIPWTWEYVLEKKMKQYSKVRDETLLFFAANILRNATKGELTREDLRRAITLAADMIETNPGKSSEAAGVILDALLWDSIKKLHRADDDVVLAKETLIACYFNTDDFSKAEDFSRQVLAARMAKKPSDAKLVRAARQTLIRVLIKKGTQYRTNGKERVAHEVINEALDLAVMNMSTGNNTKSEEDARDVLFCISELLRHPPLPILPKEYARLIRFKIMALQKTGSNESFDHLKRITLERHQLMRTYVLRLKDREQGQRVYEETQREIERFQLASYPAKEAVSLSIETEAFWDRILSDVAEHGNPNDQDPYQGAARTGTVLTDASETDRSLVLFDATPTTRNDLSEKWIKDFIRFRRGILPGQFNADTMKRIRLTVIDTGIDASHRFIEKHWNRYRHEANGAQLPLFKDFVGPIDSPTDEDGHGTFISGLVLRLAPDVELSMARVCRNQSSINKDDDREKKIAKAILYAKQTWRANIISISLGCDEEMNGDIRAAISEVRKSNTVIFCAAGNHGITRASLPVPARLDGVFKIFACESNGHASTMNPQITSDGDYCFGTLGCNIQSTWPMSLQSVGEEDGLKMMNDPKPELPGLWTVMSGTSFATPIAAALVAILYQFYDENKAIRFKKLPPRVEFKSPEVVKAILLRMSLCRGKDGHKTLVPTSGKDNYFKFYDALGKSRVTAFADALKVILLQEL